MIQRNLQKELDAIIKDIEASGKRPRLLLHVCCAPCSSYCLEYLSKYFDITIFFYNPNIDDEDEYRKRIDEEKRLILQMNLGVRFEEGEYEPQMYHQRIEGHEGDPEGGQRCSICFQMRLDMTAKKARDEGYDWFTTSLSISPMKNAMRLCTIGEEAASKYGTKYLPSDFKKRDGYKRSIELSREHGLYRQDYCGCSYSKRNR